MAGAVTVGSSRGVQGWVQRVPWLVFIWMATSERRRDNEVIHLAQLVGRTCYLSGLTPFYPRLFFEKFMTAAEIECELPQIVKKWLPRCGRVWFVEDPDEGVVLSSLGFKLLRRSASGDSPHPVAVVKMLPNGSMAPIGLRREDVDELLMQNVVPGLLANCV